MPKRSSKKLLDESISHAAEEQDEAAIPNAQLPASEKNPAAVALGRLGGKKGGLARAKKLTKEQRSAIAKKAAAARWKKKESP